MDNHNYLLLKYFGLPMADAILIDVFQQKYNLMFLVNKCSKEGGIKSFVTWLFQSDSNKLKYEKIFIKCLDKQNNYRYIVANISINNHHRNILIIDNFQLKIFFFEPHDVQPHFAISTENEARKNNIRSYFLNLLLSMIKFQNYTVGTRFRNFCHLYSWLSTYFDDAVKNIFLTQGCTETCYYFLEIMIEKNILTPTCFIMLDSFDMLYSLLQISTCFMKYEGNLVANRAPMDIIKKMYSW